jgi:hypothetical protein
MQNHARASIEAYSKVQPLDRKATAAPDQENRRAFLTKSIAAAGLVAASFFGVNYLCRTAETFTPKTIQTEMAADFATLDAAYATLGRSRIEAHLATNNQTIKIRTLGWIQERGHIGMYDLICNGLSDQNLRVAIAALGVLETINPVDLKSCQTVITTNMQVTQNKTIKEHTAELLRVIESS